MNPISVVGLDPSFAHFGMCKGQATDCALKVTELKLVNTEGRDKKVVRKSSDDMRRAKELVTALSSFCAGATIAFAEVPHGSQSARASWALGISVGVLASCPVPIIQLSALEVKMATVGKKNASKQEMIDWAYGLHPHANWLRHAGRLTQANEHLADAIAIIYAGLKTEQYAQLLATIKQIRQDGVQVTVRRRLHGRTS